MVLLVLLLLYLSVRGSFIASVFPKAQIDMLEQIMPTAPFTGLHNVHNRFVLDSNHPFNAIFSTLFSPDFN